LGITIEKVESRVKAQKYIERTKNIEYLQIASSTTSSGILYQDPKMGQNDKSENQPKKSTKTDDFIEIPTCYAVSVKITLYKRGSKQSTMGIETAAL